MECCKNFPYFYSVFALSTPPSIFISTVCSLSTPRFSDSTFLYPHYFRDFELFHFQILKHLHLRDCISLTSPIPTQIICTSPPPHPYIGVPTPTCLCATPYLYTFAHPLLFAPTHLHFCDPAPFRAHSLAPPTFRLLALPRPKTSAAHVSSFSCTLMQSRPDNIMLSRCLA